MEDKITQLLNTKDVLHVKVGDFVSIKETPKLSHINPKEACAIFTDYSNEDAQTHVNFSWRKNVIRYPLLSKLFHNMEPPFSYIIPTKTSLSSKFKVLNDPFYELSKPDITHGTISILEKSHMSEHFAKDKSIYKVINLEKKYEDYLRYDGKLDVTEFHFSGHIIQFVGYDLAEKTQDVLDKLYQDYMYTEIHQRDTNAKTRRLTAALNETVDEIRVKIVNIENIYLEIPLKLFNYA